MFTRVLAILLIFGWVSLSALDLLEDLKVRSGESTYAHSGTALSTQWNRHPSLVNNIVESAVNETEDNSPLQVNGSEPIVNLLWFSPRVLERHKLHRVFLI